MTHRPSRAPRPTGGWSWSPRPWRRKISTSVTRAEWVKSETYLVEVAREAVGDIRQHLCGEAARAGKILVERAAHMHEIDALHFASVQVGEHVLPREMGQLTYQQIDRFFQGRRQILGFAQVCAVNNAPS